MTAVLKISCDRETYRLQLGRDPSYASVLKAIEELWDSSSISSIKYCDEEGDLCILVEATFSDFLQTSQEITGGRRVLKAEVQLSPAVPTSDEAAPVADCAEVDQEDQWTELSEDAPLQPGDVVYRKGQACTVVVVSHETCPPHVIVRTPAGNEVGTELTYLQREPPPTASECKDNSAEIRGDSCSTGDISSADSAASSFNVVAERSDDSDGLLYDWCFVEHGQAQPDLASCRDTSIAEMDEEDTAEDGMEEIQAELSRIKAACEDELARHLDEWLLTGASSSTYEDWIAAVHPENVKQTPSSGYVVDERMYLEGSFHRQLWNGRVARQHHRLVLPSDAC